MRIVLKQDNVVYVQTRAPRYDDLFRVLMALSPSEFSETMCRLHDQLAIHNEHAGNNGFRRFMTE